MKIERSLSGLKPLFYNSYGNLILSKGHKIYEEKEGKRKLVCKLPVRLSSMLLAKSKLLCRLLRYGVMTATEYDGAYYFAFERCIYRFDITHNKLTCDFKFSNGRGPLSFTVVDNVEGFHNGLYFGEYISNHKKDPVKVYYRSNAWSVVFEFPQGKLNHIHGLVPDHISKCLWILGGDFDESAAIYRVRDNFENIETIVSGSQKYRSCVAFPIEGGLLYATDTQQEPNSIRLLKLSNGTWDSEKIESINGSCIYGQELPDYYVFSTSTEPSEKVVSKLASLLDNKPAPAIKFNRSDIIVMDKNTNEISRIYSDEKDIYPYRLFQFGTVMFPKGVPEHNEIAAYFVGSKKHDLTTLFFSLRN